MEILAVHKYDRQVFSPVAKLMTFNPAITRIGSFFKNRDSRLDVNCIAKI
jgi:hypothetical protein